MTTDNTTSIAAILAAEGQRGFSADRHDNPQRIAKFIDYGADELEPGSKWYRSEAQPGDFLFSNRPVVAGPDGFVMLPVRYVRSWIEWPRNKTSGKFGPVETWGKEPPDARWVQGKGGGHLRDNGNNLSDQVEIDMLVDDEPYRMQFRSSDCKIAAAFHAKAKALRIVHDGRRQPVPLFAAYWRFTSIAHDEEDQRWIELILTLQGVYGEPGGPDGDTVMRGRDLCATLESGPQYPDPSLASIIPLRRAVDGPPPINDAPPVDKEAGDGADPNDIDMPF